MFLVAASRRALAPVHSSVRLFPRSLHRVVSSRALSLSFIAPLFFSRSSSKRERSTYVSYVRVARARVCVCVCVKTSCGQTLRRLSAPSTLCPRELQLQLHARWGYAGLGRVRCTSRARPSVRPPSRFFSSPPTATLPPSSSTLFSSRFGAAGAAGAAAAAAAAAQRPLPPLVSSSTSFSSSSFSSSSFQLVLSILGRRQLPLSKSPVETCTC